MSDLQSWKVRISGTGKLILLCAYVAFVCGVLMAVARACYNFGNKLF